MIQREKFQLNYIKKEPQSGSFLGMRFTFKKNDDVLLATYYPEPYCMEKSPDTVKHNSSFELSNEGLDAAVEWLNTCYEADSAYWEAVYENRMKI